MHHLIIQSTQDIATHDLKQLAKISQASQIQAIHTQAFKLCDADIGTQAAVQAYAEQAQLDAAFIPQGLRLQDIGLVVMDMDSTLITIECIDEIADMQGLKPQVSEITEAAMRGELDFQQSLRQRVKLLKGLDESALERVYQERLQLTQGAEAMLKAIHQTGAQSLLVSGGFTFFTERLQKRLGLTDARANVLEVIDGKLTGEVLGDIVDAQMKADLLIAKRQALGLKPEQVIALGDGANDLKMLAVAGFGVAFHAKPIVRAQAQYSLNHVGLDGILAWFE